MPRQTVVGSDNVAIEIEVTAAEVCFAWQIPSVIKDAQNVFLAFGTRRESGAAVLPFAQHAEGSTVFLPFKANLILLIEIRGSGATCFIRRWTNWRWGAREQTDAFKATAADGALVVRIPRPILGHSDRIDFASYAKDPTANDGWRWLWGCSDKSVESGIGDKYIPHFYELRFSDTPQLMLRT